MFPSKLDEHGNCILNKMQYPPCLRKCMDSTTETATGNVRMFYTLPYDRGGTEAFETSGTRQGELAVVVGPI